MKKVLIVAYYFPPAGGPGVQRWLKFVKYLPDYGIQPIVYVPENPSYPIIDEDLTREISDKAIVIKKKILEPYSLAAVFSKSKTQKISSGIIPGKHKQSWLEKSMIWIRGNIFIPDARVLWVRPSVSFLKKYMTENHIDTIITTGPPHSLHLIGLHLKAQLPVRWIADFRDPWITIGYHHQLKLSNFARRKHEELEQQVLGQADDIIVTSKSTGEEFGKKTERPIHLITNGYDTEAVPHQKKDTYFSLAHIGSMLSERNPVMLWQNLAELLKEIPGFSEHLKIHLIGTVSNDVLQTIKSFDLWEYVNLVGYVSHQDALVWQRKSQVLLLVEINSKETISIIPGKLFEYMASGRPILAIGPRGSDFSDIVKQTNTGTFFDYSQKDELKSHIISLYNKYLSGSLDVKAVDVEKYSRKKLTAQLVEVLKNK